MNNMIYKEDDLERVKNTVKGSADSCERVKKRAVSCLQRAVRGLE